MCSSQKANIHSQEFTDTLFQVFTEKRKLKQITLEDVYSKLNIHQTTYHRWKNGQIPLSKSIIEKLASSLDISGYELIALTEDRMLQNNGMDNSQALLNLKFAEIETNFENMSKKIKQFQPDLILIYRLVMKFYIFRELRQSKNEKINNYSFPYHCLNILTSKIEGFFDFTLALSWAFYSFPDDTDMKEDIKRIITKHIKTTVIPSSFNKWDTLNALIQLRSYYLNPVSIKPEIDSLNYELRSFNNAIDYVEKSSSSLTHNAKKEACYELIGFAFFYFSEISREDLKILFNYLFSFILLSEKKQKNLTAELYSFCAEKYSNNTEQQM